MVFHHHLTTNPQRPKHGVSVTVQSTRIWGTQLGSLTEFMLWKPHIDLHIITVLSSQPWAHLMHNPAKISHWSRLVYTGQCWSRWTCIVTLFTTKTELANAGFVSKDMTANSCKSTPIHYPASWLGLIWTKAPFQMSSSTPVVLLRVHNLVTNCCIGCWASDIGIARLVLLGHEPQWNNSVPQ